jgi:hypothetical protein
MWIQISLLLNLQYFIPFLTFILTLITTIFYVLFRSFKCKKSFLNNQRSVNSVNDVNFNPKSLKNSKRKIFCLTTFTFLQPSTVCQIKFMLFCAFLYFILHF